MADPQTLLAFLVATLIFAYMPGPALIYATAQTIARGRRGGLLAAAGIHAGGYFHVVAASAGLGFLLAQIPVVYASIKLVGAAYLVWLGVRMIVQNQPHDAPRLETREPRRAFRQSMLVEVLNPKTALFFLAFLPQFVDPGAPLTTWFQLLILGTTVNLIFSSADILAILMADQLVARLKRNRRGEQVARWTGGSILVGLGVKLALDNAEN
jgi:threonine/homoserine/homoserine lactone efflux protein